MSDFQAAVDITLQCEGGFYHNQTTGEIVNFGITLAFVRGSGYKPDADESFIQNLTATEAVSIYRNYFWERNHIGSIADQNLANKAFDLTVNMGCAALRLLQEAVNACGGQCSADGVIGPISIAQINALDPEKLLAKFKALAAERYRHIAGNPKLAGDLSGWLARLDA